MTEGCVVEVSHDEQDHSQQTQMWNTSNEDTETPT